jgi:hypothetical protein
MIPNGEMRRNLYRWEDIIKLELKEIGCKNVDWNMDQARNQWRTLPKKIMSLRVLLLSDR